jgi:hypothetical protein
MGTYPFQLSGPAIAAALAGQTITGALSVTGLLTLTGGITTNQTYGATSLAGVNVPGNVRVNLAGDGLQVNEGANGKQGTVVLAGAATTVVPNTSVTANSRIFLTSQVDGGTPGFIRVSSRVAGTSFTISALATDTSTVAYEIFEPG